MNRKSLSRAIAIVLTTGTLAACGGGGGTPASSGDPIGSGGGSDAGGGTLVPLTTIGTITGFGSVYVNGVRFNTDNTVMRVDGREVFDQSELGVGMRVRIEGSRSPDGTTGIADTLYYDDDLDGPVENLTTLDETTKRFTVFGQPVLVDSRRTVFDDLRFDTLADGLLVEISGYFEGERLIATRAEREDDLGDRHEVKGVISGFNGGTNFDLALPSGRQVPIVTNGGTFFDLDTGLANGLFVEVEGLWNGSALVASGVDDVDDDDRFRGDADDTVLRGRLSGNAMDGWSVAGIDVILNSATRYDPPGLQATLAAGLEVEVEGRLQDGRLIARELEAYADDIDVEGPVLSVRYDDPMNPRAGTVTVQLPLGQTLEVTTRNTTLFKDESRRDLNRDGSFTLADLASSGEFLEIEAYRAADGRLVATMISREDEVSDSEVEAGVEAFVPNVSVTVLGGTWNVGPGTRYRIDDRVVDATAFWSRITVGMELEVEDDEPANGIADELSLDTDRDDD